MFLRIDSIPDKLFTGMQLPMSFANNRTREVWQKFMPRRREISDAAGPELYSMEVYPQDYFQYGVDLEAEFQKWAAMEVTGDAEIPEGMERLVAPAGMYAVFLHKGPASEGRRTYEYIHREWYPSSDYVLEYRPHFAVMGEKYKVEDPESEEEIWIPVRMPVL